MTTCPLESTRTAQGGVPLETSVIFTIQLFQHFSYQPLLFQFTYSIRHQPAITEPTFNVIHNLFCPTYNTHFQDQQKRFMASFLPYPSLLMHLPGGEKRTQYFTKQKGQGLAPACSCPMSHQRYHTVHTCIQPLKAVSLRPSRGNRRKPRVIMLKWSLKVNDSLTHDLGTTGMDTVKNIYRKQLRQLSTPSLLGSWLHLLRILLLFHSPSR